MEGEREREREREREEREEVERGKRERERGERGGELVLGFNVLSTAKNHLRTIESTKAVFLAVRKACKAIYSDLPEA